MDLFWHFNGVICIMHNTLWKSFIPFHISALAKFFGLQDLQLGLCNGEPNQPSIESYASSLIAMPRTTACSDS